MLRPFDTTTLTDIILSKLGALSQQGAEVFFAGYEPIFQEKCLIHNVPFVQRTKESAEAHDSARVIYSFLSSLPYDYFLHVNGCLPMLKTDTILKFLERCSQEEMEPCFGVVKRNNFYVTLDGSPMNFPSDISTINTRTVTPVYEFAHALYFFRKEDFVRDGFYWDWTKVKYIEMAGGTEIFDIDTEADFNTAQTLWRVDEQSMA